MEGVAISSLVNLSDQQILQIYEAAISKNLEQDFIEILENELERRGINKEEYLARQNVCN